MEKWFAPITILSAMITIGAFSAYAENVISDQEVLSEAQTVTGLEDSSELFQKFVEKQTSVKETTGGSMVRRRATISGNTAVIYDALMKAGQEIANGDRDNTELEISLSELYGVEPGFYTWAELGVQNPYTWNNVLTSEGEDAIIQKLLNIDPHISIDSAIFDEPEYFYWFDTTKGWYYGLMDGTATFFNNGVQINETGGYVLKLSVNRAFSKNQRIGTYDLDLSKTSATKKAVENAKAIVDEAKGKSDYDKLTYYKEKICDLVSYDYHAAEDDSYKENNNPWQIIYVFDGDSTTNVVCEGYAKAFKYLCDLTDFDSSEIEARLVMGKMTVDYEYVNGYDTYDPESHMWNLVHMENGKNYVVDLTNMDTGSVGYPDGIFLAGSTSRTLEDGDEESYSVLLPPPYGDYQRIFVRYLYDDTAYDNYTEDELAIDVRNYLDRTENADVTGLSLNASSIRLGAGETYLLEKEITPDDASDTSVKWSSSDENVARVDRDVLVDGVKDGSAIITATTKDENHSATCKVYVLSQKLFKLINSNMNFSDVGSNDWFYPYVRWAYQHDIVNGYSSGTFGAKDPITRTQVVQILYSASGKPAISSGTDFSDVRSCDWFYSAVRWASENGIVSGVGGGQFGTGNITREQLAIILKKYAEFYGIDTDNGAETSLSAFQDAGDVSSWAGGAVKWAVAHGVISGKGENQLDPKGEASRAEFVTMMKTFTENILVEGI